MRHLIVVLAIVGWFGLMTPAAHACTCISAPTPCEGYGWSSAVFAGTATSVRTMELPKEGQRSEIGYNQLYKFAVDQSYLGVEGTEIEILTGMGSSDCGYDFKIGERYLVYARRAGDRLITSSCTRTKAFAQATEDLAFLGTLSSAASGATIYGQLIRPPVAKTDMSKAVAEALIKIEGGGVRREVRPDAEGRYRVSGLPPGKFKVAVELSDKFYADRAERELSVGDRGCGAIDFYVFDNGRVSGKVVDPEGQPVAGIVVSMYDPERDPTQDFIKIEQTDKDGRFSIAPLAPGRFLLLVNHSRFRDPSDLTRAYASVFYPGVMDQEQAELLTMSAGGKITDLEVRVPLRRAASVLSGQIVWADGSPVENGALLFSEAGSPPGSLHNLQADAQGRFTFKGYAGQKLIFLARSARTYVPLGDKFSPMERAEPVRVTLEKPQETVKIVITKIR
jgi:hypothetical protein